MSPMQVLCRLGSRVVPRGGKRLGPRRPSLVPCTCVSNGGGLKMPAYRPRLLSTSGAAEEQAGTEVKKSGGGGGKVIALLSLAAIGAGGYYYYDTQMGSAGGGLFPSPQTNEVKRDASTIIPAVAPAAPATLPPPPPPPPPPSPPSVPLSKASSPLSPREDLLNRQAEMQAQLAELRRTGKKGDPIVDLQKKEIKDDLKIVARLLKQLEKGA